MSENIPESIPTSQDPRSKRPIKRRALSPLSKQASEVEALFANPEQEISIPLTNSQSKKPHLPAPPEIVANVQGSSAGAGSGEFHVYKASRRREYERLRIMEEESKEETEEVEFQKKKEETLKKDQERMDKNRKKRLKQKARKDGRRGEKDLPTSKADGTVHANDHDPDSRSVKEELDSKPAAKVAEPIGVEIHDET